MIKFISSGNKFYTNDLWQHLSCFSVPWNRTFKENISKYLQEHFLSLSAISLGGWKYQKILFDKFYFYFSIPYLFIYWQNIICSVTEGRNVIINILYFHGCSNELSKILLAVSSKIHFPFYEVLVLFQFVVGRGGSFIYK